MRMALPMMTLLAVALAGCSGGPADGDAEPAAAVAIAPADQPADDVPPATAPPGSVPPPAMPAGPLPGDGAIAYAGFGPARFGGTEEAVRMAWGKDLKADTPTEPGGCYYLFPERVGRPGAQASYGIGFMIEGDRFARIDVDNVDIAAPGGGRVGMGAAEIRSRYPGRIEEQQHKYVEGGRYLRVKDGAGGDGVLLFVTDAAGKVTSWRIGVAPQVDYVEACS